MISLVGSGVVLPNQEEAKFNFAVSVVREYNSHTNKVSMTPNYIEPICIYALDVRPLIRAECSKLSELLNRWGPPILDIHVAREFAKYAIGRKENDGQTPVVPFDGNLIGTRHQIPMGRIDLSQRFISRLYAPFLYKHNNFHIGRSLPCKLQ
jgi:hypothetical protein